MVIPAFVKQSFLTHFFIFCVYVISALIVTSLQCFTLPIWPISRKWYRTANGHIVNFMWLQVVWMVDYWSKSPVHLYCTDEMLEKVSGRHAVLVVNHRQDVDWLVIWQLAERFKMLRGAKCMIKNEIKYVPFFGWSFYLTEHMFVNRNYAKDKSNLMKQFQNLASYHFPTVTLIFCEGTRYTPEKYQKSLAFAKEKGLPELKHHLLPRTKGFNLCMEAYKGKVPVIYDVTIAYENNVQPSIYDLLCGKKYDFHVYCRDLPLDEVPTDTEEATSNYCQEMYQQKDRAYEYFLQNNTFAGYDESRTERVLPPTRLPQLIMYFWMLVVGVPLVYYALFTLLTGSMFTLVTVCVVSLAVYRFLNMQLRVTQSAKGSSYGGDRDGRSKGVSNGPSHQNGAPANPAEAKKSE